MMISLLEACVVGDERAEKDLLGEGADLGGGCRGCAPLPEMKLSSSYSPL